MNAAGRVGKLTLVTPLAPMSVPATTLRSAIGLRSTWFTVGVMSLQAPVPAAPLPYGLPLTLTGTCAASPASHSSRARPAARGSPSARVPPAR